MTDYCSDILKLMYAITCMHYNTLTYTRIKTLMHRQAHMHTHSLPYTLACPCMYAITQTYKQTQNTHIHVQTYTHSYNIHMYTYTQTTTEYSSDYLASDDGSVVSCKGTGDILPITFSDKCSYKTLQ